MTWAVKCHNVIGEPYFFAWADSKEEAEIKAEEVREIAECPYEHEAVEINE